MEPKTVLPGTKEPKMVLPGTKRGSPMGTVEEPFWKGVVHHLSHNTSNILTEQTNFETHRTDCNCNIECR